MLGHLVEIVLAGEDGPVGEHLCQDAADRPDVDRLGVALDTAISALQRWDGHTAD